MSKCLVTVVETLHSITWQTRLVKLVWAGLFLLNFLIRFNLFYLWFIYLIFHFIDIASISFVSVFIIILLCWFLVYNSVSLSFLTFFLLFLLVIWFLIRILSLDRLGAKIYSCSANCTWFSSSPSKNNNALRDNLYFNGLIFLPLATTMLP